MNKQIKLHRFLLHTKFDRSNEKRYSWFTLLFSVLRNNAVFRNKITRLVRFFKSHLITIFILFVRTNEDFLAIFRTWLMICLSDLSLLQSNVIQSKSETESEYLQIFPAVILNYQIPIKKHWKYFNVNMMCNEYYG